MFVTAVSGSALARQLLKRRHLTRGWPDGRLIDATSAPLAKVTDYDPQISAIRAAFAAALQNHPHRDLSSGIGSAGCTNSYPIGDNWKWTNNADDTDHGQQSAVNSDVERAQAGTLCAQGRAGDK